MVCKTERMVIVGNRHIVNTIAEVDCAVIGGDSQLLNGSNVTIVISYSFNNMVPPENLFVFPAHA